MYIPYSGETFEGENFHRLVGREHFAEKTFMECKTDSIMGVACLKLSRVAVKS